MTKQWFTDDPDAGSAVQRPLFTNEEAYNRPAAYRHNAPFAKPGPYQTRLPPALEKQFRRWVKGAGVAFNPDDPYEDYDMRGYWEDHGGATGKAPAGNFYTDTYKTPYGTTFSNQSKYATANNPFHWKDGATLIDIRDGSTVFFNPSHYASEPGSGVPQTPPFAPADVPGYDAGGDTQDEEARLAGISHLPGAHGFEPVQPAPPMGGGAPRGGPKPAPAARPREDSGVQDLMMPTRTAGQYRMTTQPTYPPVAKEFLEDIRLHGIKTPIEIRTDGTKAYVADGEHRLEAAEALGLPQVPVRVRYLPREGNLDYWPHPDTYAHPVEPFLQSWLGQIAPTDMPGHSQGGPIGYDTGGGANLWDRQRRPAPSKPAPDVVVDEDAPGLHAYPDPMPKSHGPRGAPGDTLSDPAWGQQAWVPHTDWYDKTSRAASGGPIGSNWGVPTGDVPGIDQNPVPPGAADQGPTTSQNPSSDWLPQFTAPGVGPGPGGGPGYAPGDASMPPWWRDIIEHGGPQGGHLKAPWWWIGSNWGDLPFDPGKPRLTPKAGGGDIPEAGGQDYYDDPNSFGNRKGYAVLPAPGSTAGIPQPLPEPLWTNRDPGMQVPHGHVGGSGYGTRWHTEIQHADGKCSPMPLRRVSDSAGETHWTSDVQLGPGDQVKVVTHGGTISG